MLKRAADMTYKSVVVKYKVGFIKDKTADISAAVSSIYDFFHNFVPIREIKHMPNLL